jgi:hypothetical protein
MSNIETGFAECQNHHKLSLTNQELYLANRIVCRTCGIVVKDRFDRTAGTYDSNWKFGCLSCKKKINGLTDNIAVCWKCELMADTIKHYSNLLSFAKNLTVQRESVNQRPLYYYRTTI